MTVDLEVSVDDEVVAELDEVLALDDDDVDDGTWKGLDILVGLWSERSGKERKRYATLHSFGCFEVFASLKPGCW